MFPENSQRRILDSPPLEKTKQLAAEHSCDIGIPSDSGIGNVLMYTRVVEDLSRFLGHPLTILTARLKPPIGVIRGEEPFPIWRNNPFVRRIVDADSIDPNIIAAINREKDNLCQFGHMIENIAYHYGIRPRFLRPSIYLSKAEQAWALSKLQGLRRPVVCLHPHGRGTPKPGHPWYEANWHKLIDIIRDDVTVFEIHKAGSEAKSLETVKMKTKLRQMMALVWASDLFVGFDSSVAHIATAFELPSLVLWEPMRKLEIEEPKQPGFAPAVLSRWSYPQNRNIILLGDRDDAIVNLVVAWIGKTRNSLST